MKRVTNRITMELVVIFTGVKIIVAIGAMKRTTVGGRTGRSTNRHCYMLVSRMEIAQRTLLLCLRHGGTCLANCGQRVHQDDLITNGRKRLVKPHEKLHKLLSVIFIAKRTCAVVIVRGKFVPKALETSEICGNG